MKYSTNYYRCELVKEREIPYHPVTDNSYLYDVCKDIGLPNAAEEYFYVFCCDNKKQIAGVHQVSHGGINISFVDMKDIFKRVLLNNASGIFLAHNHPSGNPDPSNQDITITAKIKEVCQLFGIELLDHMIVAQENTFSFMANGLL